MDTNTSNQSPTPTEAKSTPSAQLVNKTKSHLSLMLGILVLLFAVGGGGYYLGAQTKSNPQNQTAEPSNGSVVNTQSQSSRLIITPTQALVQQSTGISPTITEDGFVLYEHPTLNYTLEYPANWKNVTENYGTNFFVQSPDFQREGAILEKGATFVAIVNNSTVKSVDDFFNQPIVQQTGKNKTMTTVDGVQAAQYDFAWEGVNATNTEFLKNGKQYTIQFAYLDEAGKKAEWNTYQHLLNSFKTK